MKLRTTWIALAIFLGTTLFATAAPGSFALPAPVMEIASSPEAFARFVAPVRAALAAPELDAKLRLGMQVHLALNDRDAKTALAAAAELRALQTEPAEKAFTGLVTEAQVASWASGATFAQELTRRLATLPATAKMTAVLRKQHEKIAATTRDGLLAEAATLGRQLDGSGQCDWTGADQIIRTRHRLTNILPLREAMLTALDAAIAERPQP